ncbi:phage tail protein [Streptomyces sp. NPDC056084]|uniref:phage tail tube protein n=1 Tax=unclassified Streptomyces TaxID=2593676 RepID=UPI0035E26AC3
MVNITRSSDLALVGANGGGWVAATGTSAPASPSTQPASPWQPLGAISDNGLVYGFDEASQEFTPWGLTSPFRRAITKSIRTFKMDLWETARVSVASLMYRIPSDQLTPTAGVTSYAETASPQPDRRAFYFVVMDGTSIKGFFVPQGEVTDRADVTYKQSDMSGYQITITAYPDAAGNTVYHSDFVPPTPAYTGS